MKWLIGLFKWDAPVARMEYLLSLIGANIVFAIIYFLFMYGNNGKMPVAAGIAIIIGYIYVQFLLVVRRFWDLTESLKWGFILALIYLICCAIPGKIGTITGYIRGISSLIGGVILLFCPSGLFSRKQ